MAVIAVHDADFFNYEHVIPNLECAKLVEYYRRRNEITLLTPIMEPARFSKFFYRKEYDDGIYPRQIFLQNCEYGGRAFNFSQYKPLAPEIENIIPNMHIYADHANHFGHTQSEQKQFSRILNCAHMRLAPDSENLLSFEQLQRNFQEKVTGIFLHDYDLASLKPYDLIKQLQDQRHFVMSGEINPYPVGNKYPIYVSSPEELEKWCQLVVIPNAFFMEYRGLMPDSTLYNLCLSNRRMARQLYYNISRGCSSEDQFFKERLRQIIVQSLFLKRQYIRILLTYDEDFFVTKELRQLIQFLNYMIVFKWQEGFLPARQSLYDLASSHKKYQYTNWAFRTITLTVEEIRNIFQYVREHDYETFKLFYEWDAVVYKEGQFINEWTGNPCKYQCE